MRMRYDPIQEVNEGIAYGSTNPVISLFEERNLGCRYCAKNLLSLSENATHIGIYRRYWNPDSFLGKFFNRRVAIISHYSWINGYHTDVGLYGKQLVTIEEVRLAAVQGLKNLALKLESAHNQGLF